MSDPLTNELTGNDMEFWHTLSERPVPSNDDAFHAMLLYFDEKDAAADYAGRVESLKQRGWLPTGFDESADLAVTRGTLAVVLANALEIKGGLTRHLFAHSPRYALRELIYLGIIPAGSTHQTFSGGQFVALIGRVEDYQRTRAPVAYTEGAQ